MNRYLLALALLTATISQAQQEGPNPTQAVVVFESKGSEAPNAGDITVKVGNHTVPVTSVSPIRADDTQIALLMDDGLRVGVGREMGAIRAFINGLPAGVEVFIGYMQNGRVVPAGNLSGFSADHAAVAQTLHLPSGIPGSSASPYFCLSDLVKQWPGRSETQLAPPPTQPSRKARFVLMITNGVDPYNGSTSVLNQDSPYVASTIKDVQRAGIPVYSIFFDDAGFRVGGAGRPGGQNFSGQNYLNQLAEGSGGVNLWQGFGNPVSTDPFLKQFGEAIARSFVVGFPMTSRNENLEQVKVSTSLPKTKVRSAQLVRPGNVVLSQ